MPRWLSTNLYQGLVLLVHDVVALYVSIGIIHQLRLGYWVPEIDLSMMLVIVIAISTLYIMNVYHVDRQGSSTSLALRTFVGVVLSGGAIASLIYVTKATDVTTVLWRSNLPLSMLLFAVWTTTIRYLATQLVRRYVKEPLWLVLGTDKPLMQAFKKDQMHANANVTLQFVEGQSADLNHIELDSKDGILNVTNPPQELFSGHVDGVVLTTTQPLPDSLVSQVMRIRLGGLSVLDLSDFYERFLLRVPVMQLKDHWFALSQGFSLLHHEFAWKVKRLIDVVVAAVGLIVLLPLIPLIVILVRMTSRGPAFYNQIRCGHKGKKFILHKFRTMFVDAENDSARWTQAGDPRVTSIGRVLRITRLDEVPQLWNVLTGDMSFIGPRPEQPDFVETLEKDIPYYDLRHLVKPGITGWAQVMYPYGASVEDAKNKLEYDLYYIKNYSLALDAYILLRTLRVVFSGSGR